MQTESRVNFHNPQNSKTVSHEQVKQMETGFKTEINNRRKRTTAPLQLVRHNSCLQEPRDAKLIWQDVFLHPFFKQISSQ